MTARPQWFEDFHPGDVWEFGEYRMGEAEILDFARRYDPQSFHTDPEAARHSIYGGLIASGWNTVGAMMRMLVDHHIPAAASMGSPGVDELRWLRPVRPGDVLRLRVTMLEATRSRSKPDRGVTRSLVEVLNQAGEVVMTLRAMGMYRTRPASA